MLCFVFSALVVVLDQLFKRWITITLAVGDHKDVIPSIINLTHVENYGAAFSILSGKRWLLAAVMFVAIIIIVAILLRYTEGFWGTLGLAAVLGGAVGNLIDRVFVGHVVDMFEFKFIEFAIFNIADIFITLGGLTFLIFFIVTSFKSSKNTEEAADSSDYWRDSEPGGSSRAGGNNFDDYDDYDFDEGYDDDYEDDNFEEEPLKPYLRPMPEREPEAYEEYPMSPFAPVRTPEPVESAAEFIPDEPEDDTIAYEPPPRVVTPSVNIAEPQTEPKSLLDELGLLESDLEGAEEFDESDIDDLLREYGFEDDDKG